MKAWLCSAAVADEVLQLRDGRVSLRFVVSGGTQCTMMRVFAGGEHAEVGRIACVEKKVFAMCVMSCHFRRCFLAGTKVFAIFGCHGSDAIISYCGSKSG